jgi:hypothetical protein
MELFGRIMMVVGLVFVGIGLTLLVHCIVDAWHDKSRRDAEFRRDMALRNAKRQQQAQAEQQSERLVELLLSPVERQQLNCYGYLEIPSPSRQGRVYRVPRGRGMVSVYEDGRAVMSLCVQPVEWIPASDIVLMHKLMIEGNEEDYLKRANQFEPGYPYYLRWGRRTLGEASRQGR